jgi:tetratricopeptide (TPR) repeat protein
VLTNYAAVSAQAGYHEQALRLIDRALRVVPTHPRALLDLAHVYILAGQPDRARAAFARADTTHPHYAVYHAEMYALLGETDSAFASLDRVKEWALPSLVGLNNSPSYASLRADPRYRLLRARLGMPPR